MKNEIEESAFGYHERYRIEQDIVVGVNKFVEDSPEVPDILRVDPESERQQVERLKAFKADRDAGARRAAAGGGARRRARGTDNLLPVLRQALKDRCSMGEVCGAMRDVFGEYQPVLLSLGRPVAAPTATVSRDARPRGRLHRFVLALHIVAVVLAFGVDLRLPAVPRGRRRAWTHARCRGSIAPRASIGHADQPRAAGGGRWPASTWPPRSISGSAFYVQWGLAIAVVIGALGGAFFPRERAQAVDVLAERDIAAAGDGAASRAAEVAWSQEYKEVLSASGSWGPSPDVLIVVTIYLMTVHAGAEQAAGARPRLASKAPRLDRRLSLGYRRRHTTSIIPTTPGTGAPTRPARAATTPHPTDLATPRPRKDSRLSGRIVRP